MREVVIVAGARTAVGTMNGSLKDVHQADLGALVCREAVRRAGIDPAHVDEVIVGNVGQVAESGFLGRMVSLKAGFPESVTASAVNRQCASGLEAINQAAMRIRTGQADVVVAAGTENMNQLPYYVRHARYGYRFGHGNFEDGLLTILTWPLGPYPNGLTAENLAVRFGIGRTEQDRWAIRSQEKAAAYLAAPTFTDEIVPVEVRDGKEIRQFMRDEHPRQGITLEKLAKLKPAFKDDGTVTPGNASGINDGAGAVALMGGDTAARLGLEPWLRVTAFAEAGCDPAHMGWGPVPATRKALERAGLSVADVDLAEVNEAFAVQTLVDIRELGLDEARVNVNGGAIALGHPIGATGVILTVRLMYEMRRREVRRGLVTMCAGGGQGVTTVFERCDRHG